MQVITHVRITEPVDGRYGQIGKILRVDDIGQILELGENEIWYSLQFEDGTEGAYQDNEVEPIAA